MEEDEERTGLPDEAIRHKPVMLREVLLAIREVGARIIVDATVGYGGYAEALLSEVGNEGKYIGIDRDEQAVSYCENRFKDQIDSGVMVLINEKFSKLGQSAASRGFSEANAIIFDLGVSSPQLEDAERGFSYMKDGPLDMRMDKEEEITAMEVVNSYERRDLEKILRRYGEEKWASRIAKFIDERRKRDSIRSTFELVDVIKSAIPASARRKGPHPAKRTFQALRIEINKEIEELERGLEEGLELLANKGILIVLSYHSIEDRIVKRFIKESSLEKVLSIKKPFPKIPDEDELNINPRARSAKMRTAVKIV